MKSGNTHFELMSKLTQTQRMRTRMALLAVFVLVVAAIRPASALNINLTFDTDANLMAAGLTATDIANMKAACASAATQFTSRYSDPINVNIMVTSSAGTSDLGSSNTFFDTVASYTALRNAFAADSKTADDATTVGAGGSLPAGADPITTTHIYNVTRAQAKALGLRPDDMLNDGTFNFGGGNKWTYDPNNRNVAGSFDFIGVAMHEYSEIMGRNSIMADPNFGNGMPNYVAFDLFHYTGAGARGLNNGPNRFFSFDNGTSLLIAFNDAVANPGSDLQDWAGPAPDSFNAAGPPGEQDDMTPVDLQTMDVIGYDRGTAATTTGSVANISTRLPVGIGDNLLITGFIVTGPAGSTKKVIVRGIGPSTNVPGALADPILELHDNSGALIASNDNWKTTVIGGIITADQSAEIQASGVAPKNDAESALIATLAPGNYTAQIRGVNNSTGIGVAEAFDLSLASAAKLANVSTRGFVQIGDNLMIGGFIVVNNPVRVVVRGIGPSLAGVGIQNPLADPTIELRDGAGGLVLANDNWKATQQADIMATGLQPSNDLESALVITLQPGNYTALLRGTNNGTGIGVVEVYALASTTPTPTAKLFIANGNNGTITTSNADGTGGTALAGNISPLLMAPQGIAINAAAGKIYAGNEGGDMVTQANLDGTGAVNLTLNGLLKGPYGVALDVQGNKMYVANGGGGITGNSGFVVRADLDGSNAARLTNLDATLSQQTFPQGIAINVAGNKMYVAVQNGAIIQANLDGSNPTALNFGGLLTGSTPLDVALNVTGNRMYVADFNGNLFSADLSGNNGTKIGTLNGTLNAPRGMGVDVTGGKIYVSNSGNNTVTQADLPDGANPVVLTIATLNAPAVVGVYRAP
jgi:DNA-binding beta-propeller fold protein YncE